MAKKDTNKLTIKEYIGKGEEKKIRKRLEDFLNDTNGFLIIATYNNNTYNNKKITDCYKGVCKKCVMNGVVDTVKDANKMGLLWKEEKNKK